MLRTIFVFLASIQWHYVCLGSEIKQKIPTRPTSGENHTFDYAGMMIGDQFNNKIRFIQEKAQNEFEVPIVLVSIDRVDDYFGYQNIRDLAQAWFVRWALDYKYHRALLVLVSIEDKTAYIEGGREWSYRWKAHLNKLVFYHLIYQMQKNQARQGVYETMAQLLKMAGADPVLPPRYSMLEKIKYSFFRGRIYSSQNFLAIAILICIMLFGSVLILVSFIMPKWIKSHLLMSGFFLVGASLAIELMYRLSVSFSGILSPFWDV